MSTGQGLRYDEGKLRLDLVHPWAHEQMAKVLTLGAQKYAPRNWEQGMVWSKVIASLKRHMSAIERGEDYDQETGILHAAHVACNAHFLTAYYKIYPQGDDRVHSYLNPLKIGLDIDGVIADFHTHFCKTVGIENYDPAHWNDPIIRSKFEEVKIKPEFWATMPVLNSELPFEPHAYITSRSIDPKLTQKWLDDNSFPSAPLYCVGHNMSKVEVAKQSGVEIFVDDKYENFIELNKAGICCFLFDASHNKKYDVGFKRIYNLKDLI